MRQIFKFAKGQNARNLKNAIEMINLYCDKVNLPNQIKVDSIELMKRILSKKLTKGRSMDVLIVTSVYISCLFNQEPVPLALISRETEIPKLKISKNYRAIIRDLDLKIPPPDLHKYLEHYSKIIDLSEDIINLAKSIISLTIENNIAQGKEPLSIIGAVIYISALTCGKRCTQMEISEKLCITAATIRSRYHEILQKLDLDRITKMGNIKMQLREHLENAEDWEKMDANLGGVYIVKVPATNTRPALLFLEINPINDNGKPIKRRGLFIRTNDQLSRFFQAITDDRLDVLIQTIEKINSQQKTSKMKKLKM